MQVVPDSRDISQLNQRSPFGRTRQPRGNRGVTRTSPLWGIAEPRDSA